MKYLKKFESLTEIDYSKNPKQLGLFKFYNEINDKFEGYLTNITGMYRVRRNISKYGNEDGLYNYSDPGNTLNSEAENIASGMWGKNLSFYPYLAYVEITFHFESKPLGSISYNSNLHIDVPVFVKDGHIYVDIKGDVLLPSLKFADEEDQIRFFQTVLPLTLKFRGIKKFFDTFTTYAASASEWRKIINKIRKSDLTA